MKGESTAGRTWQRFRRSKLASLALLYVIVMTVLAFFAPVLANDKPIAEKTPDGWQFPAVSDIFKGDPDFDVPRGAATLGLRPADDDRIPMACGSGAECAVLPGACTPEGADSV